MRNVLAFRALSAVTFLAAGVGMVAGVGCAAGGDTERVAAQISSLSPDGGQDLKKIADDLNTAGPDAGEKDVLRALERHEIAAVLVKVSTHTSVSEQVLGKEIEGSGKAVVLGAVSVKVEGRGNYNVEKRLVLSTGQGRYIVAGHPDTVRAALDAIQAACLARVKMKQFELSVGEEWAPLADSCCEVIEVVPSGGEP